MNYYDYPIGRERFEEMDYDEREEYLAELDDLWHEDYINKKIDEEIENKKLSAYIGEQRTIQK